MVIAAIPRLYGLSSHSINSDELAWMRRGKIMVSCLQQGRFIEATQSLGHPGIPPAFLIGVFQRMLGHGSLGETDGIMDDVTAARLPALAMGIATVVAVFLLGRRLFSSTTAWFAALLIALDPTHIGLSRIAHVDTTLAFFFTAAILFYIRGDLEGRDYYKIIAGILWGCAYLTKIPAVTLPVILATWKLLRWAVDRHPARSLCSAADVAALLSGIGVYLAGFTQLWAPLEGQWHRYAMAPKEPYEIARAVTSFVRNALLFEMTVLAVAVLGYRRWRRNRGGQINERKQTIGWAVPMLLALALLRFGHMPIERLTLQVGRQYSFSTLRPAEQETGGMLEQLWQTIEVIVFKTPEFHLAFFALALPLTFWGMRSHRRSILAFSAALIPAAIFLPLLNVRDGPVLYRYTLPVLPMLFLMSGYALARIAAFVSSMMFKGNQRASLCAVSAFLVIASAPMLAAAYPNYHLYFNRLIGGPDGADRRGFQVGWHEGYAEAARALRTLIDQDFMNVSVVGGNEGQMRYHWRRVQPRPVHRVRVGIRPLMEADYIVEMNTAGKHKTAESAAFDQSVTNPPLQVISHMGFDIARIYAHTRQPEINTRTYEAEDIVMNQHVGRKTSDSKASGGQCVAGDPVRDPPGWLLLGPFRSYATGEYRAGFRLRTPSIESTNHIGSLVVYDEENDTELSRRVLSANDFTAADRYQSIDVPFRISGMATIETRIYFNAVADLRVDNVTVTPIATP